MLVLTRKLQEQIRIGDNIVVTILQIRGQSVRVGIEAPKNVRVLRAELPIKDTQAATSQLSAVEMESAAVSSAMMCTQSQPLASRLRNRRAPSASNAAPMDTRGRLGPAMLAAAGACAYGAVSP